MCSAGRLLGEIPLSRCLLLATVLFLTSCRLLLGVSEGGQILSESGAYHCAEPSCIYDLPEAGVDDTFTAEPDTGYRFVGWESVCKDDGAVPCQVNLSSLFTTQEGDVELLAIFEPEDSRVLLETDLGDIEIRLYLDESPVSSANFLSYVDSGFYDGLIFHRVIPGFMVQAGGFDENMEKPTTQSPIVNESSNGLANTRATLAFARTSFPDSATSQFFINLVDNASLDYRSGEQGYAVFAEVIQGMDVVDAIAAQETQVRGGYADVPVNVIRIISATRLPFNSDQ